MIRALDERNAHPRPNGLGLHDHLCATALEFGRGAQVIVEPKTIRPGVRIAFIQGPDDVRIELLERTVIEVSEAAGR